LGTMTKVKRKFTPEERLSILKEGEREGQTETIRKYNIAPSLYSRWKRKYTKEGFSGLQDKHKKIDPAIKALEEENERLKRIVAKQALEIEVKSELLKKTPIGSRKK
jgi:transposase-like protein